MRIRNSVLTRQRKSAIPQVRTKVENTVHIYTRLLSTRPQRSDSHNKATVSAERTASLILGTVVSEAGQPHPLNLIDESTNKADAVGLRLEPRVSVARVLLANQIVATDTYSRRPRRRPPQWLRHISISGILIRSRGMLQPVGATVRHQQTSFILFWVTSALEQ